MRIMTIHGAKGLEYPIVALANLGARNQNDAQPVPREQEHFLHFRVGAGSAGRHGHFKTPGYDDAWEQEKHIRRSRAAAPALRRRHPRPRAPDHPRASPASLSANGPARPRSCTTSRSTTAARQAGRARRARRCPTSRTLEPSPVTEAEIDGRRRRARGNGSTELEAAQARTRARPREIEIASSRERAARPARRRGRDLRRGARDRPGAADPDRRRRPHGDGARHPPATRTTSSRSPTTSARRARSPSDTGRRDLDVPRLPRLAERQARARARELVARGAVHGQPRRATANPPERAPLTNGRVDLVYRDGDELVVVDYKTDKDVHRRTPPSSTPSSTTAARARCTRKGLATATGLPVREVVFVYCKAGAEVRLREGDGEESSRRS